MIKTPIHLMEEVVFSKKDAKVEDYLICDADWRDQSGLALYVLAQGKGWLVLGGEWIASPITDNRPFIRWLDGDRLLLVQRRSRGHEPNVHIVNRDGEIVGSFHAGDAIEGVVVGPEGIWISYYYGTVRKGLPGEKLVLFDLKGTPVFKYESDLAAKPDILEVLALVKGKGSSIWMVPLTKPLVEIDAETSSFIVHEDPKLLNAGTFAVSIRGDFVYFVLEDTEWAYACRIGEEVAQPIGKIEGLSRGLGPFESCNFIAYPKTGGEVKLYRIQNKEEYFLA